MIVVCRRQVCAMLPVTPVALYTKLDAKCGKQKTVVGRLLTTHSTDGRRAVVKYSKFTV